MESVRVELSIGALLDPSTVRRMLPGRTMGLGVMSSLVRLMGLPWGAGIRLNMRCNSQIQRTCVFETV